MRYAHFNITTIVIVQWIFSFSCQGLKNNEENDELNKHHKASRSFEKEVIFNFEQDAAGYLPNGMEFAQNRQVRFRKLDYREGQHCP